MAKATLGDNCMADRHLNAGNGPHSAHKLVALDPLLAIQSVNLQYERASGCMENRSFVNGRRGEFRGTSTALLIGDIWPRTSKSCLKSLIENKCVG